MNKRFTLICGIALAASTTAAAQQLPNADFEGTWSDCVPWNSQNYEKVVGQNPASWCVSNVSGLSKAFLWVSAGKGATQTGEKISGNNSSSAVKVYNSPNTYLETVYVPGYVTLGTTWSTSSMNKDNDGGVFGGIAFTNRPDAVSFDYQHTSGTREGSPEQATVVAYLWKGTYTQVDVPANIVGGGDCTTATLTDRDRNILDMATAQGGDVTSKGTRIAQINYALTTDASSWTAGLAEFTYDNLTEIPEKGNVIFSAGNYFNATPVAGCSLSIDNVKMLYYSRLASLNIGGAAVSGFDSKTYSYNVNGTFDANPTYTVLGASPAKTVTVTNDPAAWSQSIRVANTNTGTGVEDYDGAAAHTYTVQYAREARTGYSRVIENGVASEMVSNAAYFGSYYNSDKLNIKVNIDGVGEVVIDGLTRKNDGTDVYAADGIYLDGEENWSFCSDLIVYGDGNDFIVNIFKDGKTYLWTSNAALSGVGAISGDAVKVAGKAGAISITGANGTADIYTIDGRCVASVEVAGAAEVSLAKGIYLVRTAGKTAKVVVK